MRGLSANFNEFLGSHNAAEFGDRRLGSIFASPEARGADGFYHGRPEADVFEMAADVPRNYRLNPTLTDVTGSSMGADATYELATRCPDPCPGALPAAE